jgi:serine/threonine protein phosphatase PrpC
MEEDKFLLMATDGIWEFMSNEHCLDIIKLYYESGEVERAADHLMQVARGLWSKEETIDDITFVLAFFN